MKRFSDFAEEETALEGEKVSIDDVINRELTVVGFRLAKSRYSKNESGKYATVQFKDESGQLRIFFTGSDVIIDQLEKYKCELPFVASIVKINRYYTFK